MRKATVIGVGSLGSTIAYEIANRELVDELVLIDVYRNLAKGNAGDIAQSVAFRSNVHVTGGDYEDLDGSQVIIVTAGKPRTPDMKSRTELLEANKKIVGEVATRMKRSLERSVVVTLTNPVDVMNYLMWKSTGLDRRRVIGSAGMLDSARLRTVLSRRYHIPVLDVDAFVIGEHGDNQVPIFSRIKIRGETKSLGEEERTEIAEELKYSAIEVISSKGATIFAPANNTVNLIQAILENQKKLFVCSAILDGEYALTNLSIGVPVILGENGLEQILQWDLTDYERRNFYAGAESICNAIATVSI